ncbi:hypothetical protein [Emticicia fontis]
MKIKIGNRAIMVGTFFNEGNIGFQKINITTTKTGPEKVYATVTTFLKKDNNGLWIISVNKCFNEILKQFQPMNLSKKNHFLRNKEYSEYPYFSI